MNPHDWQIHFCTVVVVMGPEGTLAAVDERPAPGEELNTGRATEPRQAATVILLRGGDERLEVLLVRRNPAARFMGGAWVFPGGAVDAGEDHRVAGLREVEEEAGVTLADPGELVPFSRWITPEGEGVKIRFDTWFFAARGPEGAEPTPDGAECVSAAWLAPAAALERHGRGDLQLVFPTIKHLEQLARFGSVEEALETARGREIVPVEPRVLQGEDGPQVVLPGEPGYDG
jgi:8-oxo-dGTP pyrophosphatase MutT (NUDIX family)